MEIVKKNMVCAMIFKREQIKDEETSYNPKYTCTPIKIVNGFEICTNNEVYFMPLNSNKCYYPMSSEKNIDKSQVYAFPIDIENLDYTDENKILISMNMKLKQLQKNGIFTILQEFDEQDNTLNTFIHNKIAGFEGIVDSNNIETLEEEMFKDEFVILKVKENESKIESLKEIKKEIKKKIEDKPYADEIYKKITKTVKCQDEQVKTIASIISRNLRISNSKLKSNIFICGPTGSGKTEIIRMLEKNIDIPIAMEDTTEYTAASFKGKDVIQILNHLLESANQNLEKAEHGIIFLDEIDKKASKGEDTETYTSAVISGLLKMAEGHTYYINVGNGEIPFDTSYVTFIFGGAFDGIENFVKPTREIGFITEEPKEILQNKIYTTENLKRYGIPPELLGRSSTIVALNKLNKENLIEIIETSEDSQLLLYKKFLKETANVDFIYTRETIEAIAEKAQKAGLGARSIKKIVNDAIADADYKLMSKNNYSTFEITLETIEDNKKYILK